MKKRNLLGVLLLLSLLLALLLIRQTGPVTQQRAAVEKQAPAHQNSAAENEETGSQPSANEALPNTAWDPSLNIAGNADSGSGTGPAAQPIEVPIFGTVIYGANKEPAAGATVVLRSTNYASQAKSQEVTAGPDGSFHFTTRELGAYVLFAHKQAFVSENFLQFNDLLQVNPDVTAIGPVQLILQKSFLLTIEVVDKQSRKPIPYPWADFNEWPHSRIAGDERGVITAPIPTGQISLGVFAQNYAFFQSKIMIQPQDDGGSLIVALEPGGVLRGTVVNEEGVPLAGVNLSTANRKRSLRAVSDPSGQFQISHLPLDQNVSGYFNFKGYQPGRFGPETFAANQRELFVDLVLKEKPDHEEESALWGVISDLEGEPLAGVTISNHQKGEAKRQCQSGSDGSYLLEHLPTGHMSLQVKKEGYVAYTRPLQLKERPKQRLDLVMEEAQILEGRVVDEAGRAIANASVSWNRTSAEATQYGNTKCGSNGHFLLENLPTRFTLYVSADGYSPKMISSDVLDQQPAEIVLQAKGILNGRVIAKHNGEPIKTFGLRVAIPISGSRLLQHHTTYEDWTDFPTNNGSFTLTNLPMDQEMALWLKTGEYPPQAFQVTAVTDGSNKTKTFELDRERLRVAGTVLDEDELPMAAVNVVLLTMDTAAPFGGFHWDSLFNGRLQNQALFYQTVRSGGDGHFEFSSVPADLKLELAVYGAGAAMTHLPNLATQFSGNLEQLIVRPKEAAMIGGKVNREKYPGRVAVQLTGGQTEGQLVALGSQTADYAFEHLQAGGYSVELVHLEQTGQQQVVDRAKFQLEAGESKTVDLGFDRGYTLSGLAQMEKMPLANGFLFLYSSGGNDGVSISKQTRCGPAGDFRFEDLPAGLYKLIAFANNPGFSQDGLYEISRHPNQVKIKITSEDVDDVFSFTRYSTVTGNFRNREVGDALILIPEDSTTLIRRLAIFGTGGSFRFPEVAPGSYQLILRKSSPSYREIILVNSLQVSANGEDLDLGDLQLEEGGSLRVTVSQSENTGPSYMSLSLIQDSASETLRKIEQLQLMGNNAVFDHLEPGSYRVMPNTVFYPIRSEPTQAATQIEAGRQSELQFRIFPATLLQIRLHSTNGQIARGLLKHDASGTEMAVAPRQGNLNELAAQSNAFAIWTNGMVIAKNLVPGDWQITLVTTDNQSWQEDVVLKSGQLITREAHFSSAP